MMNKMSWAWALVMLLSMGLVHAQASAEDPKKVYEEAKKAAQAGPAEIRLGEQATLKLAEGRLYIPQPHASRLLRAMGNPGEHQDLLGLVFPRGEGDWFATLRYEASGYIKDDDAKTWNADELLKSYREGTAAANEERRKMGVAGLEIVGWAEQPHYSAEQHRLVWAMSSREQGAAADQEQGVNYNTYALGREGYLSLNLVTGLQQLPQYKSEAQELLSAMSFEPGKRYGDFNAQTDKVAEYGLAALVLGVGAKKLGLFAVALAFLAKFAKLFVVGGLALGGLAMKLLGRKKAQA